MGSPFYHDTGTAWNANDPGIDKPQWAGKGNKSERSGSDNMASQYFLKIPVRDSENLKKFVENTGL